MIAQQALTFTSLTQHGHKDECLKPSAGPQQQASQLQLNLFSGKFTLSKRAFILPGNGKAGLQDETI